MFPSGRFARIVPAMSNQYSDHAPLIDRLRGDLRLDNAIQFLKSHATIEETEADADKHDCAFEKGEAA